MRSFSWGIFAALALAGCGDDGGGGGGEDGSTGAASSSSGGPAGSSTGAGETTGGGGTGDSSTGGAADSSSGGPTEVTVSGQIQDFFAGGPIADAQISLLSDPSIATVGDAEGFWELVGVPADGLDRILIDPTDEYWGALVPLETMGEDLDDVDLSQVSIQVVDIQESALQNQEPTVIVDETKAAFLVVLRQPTAVGPTGMPVTVDLDPPPPLNTYYAPISATEPVLNLNEINWPVYPVMVFFNLEPAPEGTYTLSATHPERECTFPDASPPTFERHINLVYVDCLPP